MTYKVVIQKVLPITNEKGEQKHLMVPRKGGKQFGTIPMYEHKTEIIQSGMSFDEAKTVRKNNKNSTITKE